MKHTNITKLKSKESATIEKLPAEVKSRYRLEELGLRIGSKITLKKMMALGGPAVIICDSTEIAIGRALALQIIVQKDRS